MNFRSVARFFAVNAIKVAHRLKARVQSRLRHRNVALFEQLAGVVESVLIYKAAEIYSQRPLKDALYVLIIVPKGVRRRF